MGLVSCPLPWATWAGDMLVGGVQVVAGGFLAPDFEIRPFTVWDSAASEEVMAFSIVAAGCQALWSFIEGLAGTGWAGPELV